MNLGFLAVYSLSETKSSGETPELAKILNFINFHETSLYKILDTFLVSISHTAYWMVLFSADSALRDNGSDPRRGGYVAGG